MVLVFGKLVEENKLIEIFICDYLVVILVGIYGENLILDLNYEEDLIVEVDMNIVMIGSG